MKTFTVFISLLPIVLFANPILSDIVNEFQTDTALGQKVEFHFPLLYDTVPLLDAHFYTPGGVSWIDTPLVLPTGGYAAIDRSVLYGPFFLAITSGAFGVVGGNFGDSIAYPDTPSIPAPQPGKSVARYMFYINTAFYPKFDWYLDATPTFGDTNDDYPGCRVTGHVYRNGNPAEETRLIANCSDSVYNPYPYATICTTYSQGDGSYQFDSLVPATFRIEAFLAPYNSIVRTTPVLHASRPINNFDFSFIGIQDRKSTVDGMILVYPNPFRRETYIRPATKRSSTKVKIYNLNGRLVRILEIRQGTVWHGEDDIGHPLPDGIYFCQVETLAGPAITKIIKLR